MKKHWKTISAQVDKKVHPPLGAMGTRWGINRPCQIHALLYLGPSPRSNAKEIGSDARRRPLDKQTSATQL